MKNGAEEVKTPVKKNEVSYESFKSNSFFSAKQESIGENSMNFNPGLSPSSRPTSQFKFMQTTNGEKNMPLYGQPNNHEQKFDIEEDDQHMKVEEEDDENEQPPSSGYETPQNNTHKD